MYISSLHIILMVSRINMLRRSSFKMIICSLHLPLLGLRLPIHPNVILGVTDANVFKHHRPEFNPWLTIPVLPDTAEASSRPITREPYNTQGEMNNIHRFGHHHASTRIANTNPLIPDSKTIHPKLLCVRWRSFKGENATYRAFASARHR